MKSVLKNEEMIPTEILDIVNKALLIDDPVKQEEFINEQTDSLKDRVIYMPDSSAPYKKATIGKQICDAKKLFETQLKEKYPDPTVLARYKESITHFTCRGLNAEINKKDAATVQTRRNIVISPKKEFQFMIKLFEQGQEYSDCALLALALTKASGRHFIEISVAERGSKKEDGEVCPPSSPSDFKISGKYLITHNNQGKIDNAPVTTFPVLIPADKWLSYYELMYSLKDGPVIS